MQLHYTTLNCSWFAGGGHSSFEAQHFFLDSDLTARAEGSDTYGHYKFTGSADQYGNITLSRTYQNLPTVMPICFQGRIESDSSLKGVVINNGMNAGSFVFKPTFRLWTGELDNLEGSIEQVMFRFNFVGMSIYGYGKDNQGIYILKGQVDPATYNVKLSEFRVNRPGRIFEGNLEYQGNLGILNGIWKNGSTGQSGSIKLSEFEGAENDIPPMDIIDTKSDLNIPKPSKPKELAKGAPKVTLNPTIPEGTQPLPQGGALGANPQPQFRPPGYQQYQGSGQMNPFQTTYFFGGLTQIPMNLNAYVDSNHIINCSTLPGVHFIAGQIYAGKKVQMQDFLNFYKLCHDDQVKISMTHTVANALVGVDPQSFYLAIKYNANSDVQLNTIQYLGHYVRGMLDPGTKEAIVDVIVFNAGKAQARSLLAQL